MKGNPWQLVGLEYHYISSLEISSFDDIFVGTRGHWQYSGGRIFKSLDPMGNSWEIKLENNLIADMDINDYNTLFIGCSAEGYPGGVFCSYDNGDNWNDLSSGLPTRYIEKVFVSPDNILYVVTYATYRLYRFNDPISNKFCEKVDQIKVFPNPANKNIDLKGLIPYNAYYGQILNTGGHVMMDFELMGKQAGNLIGIENLKNGVYFLVLKSKDEKYVSKFIKY
ncbi:MAG: T9SS type A sorting domain-containing protein [Bacteroidota bacterium]|nr:T9SS type A sorting domain-containing protein [Bacteroidota bacterium]